jgi:uncharacterized repeat protein (TIGR01451 family)
MSLLFLHDKRRFFALLIVALMMVFPGGIRAGMASPGPVDRQAEAPGIWRPIPIAGLDSSAPVYVFKRHGSLWLVGASLGGLFRSTDNGVSWQSIDKGNVRDVWMDSAGQTLVAATYGAGLLRSTNAGANWSPVGSETPYWLSLTEAVTPTHTLYAGSLDKGVWRSTDAGQTWTRTAALDGQPDMGVIALAAAEHAVYAGSLTDGLFRTTDAGETWERLGASVLTGRVRAIVVGSGQMVVSVWDGGLYRSTDEGNTWEKYDTGLEEVNVIALLDVNGLWAGTVGRGIYRWNAAMERWTAWGLRGRHVYSLTIQDHTLYAGSNGALWTMIPGVTLNLTSEVGVGETASIITYTLAYRNGPWPLEDVGLYNVIPEGVELVQESITQPGYSIGDMVLWPLGHLESDAQGLVRYQVRRDPPSRPVTNQRAWVTWWYDGQIGLHRSNAVWDPGAWLWLPLVWRD